MKIINGKQQKGFAVMSRERKHEIARLGGKAVARKRGSKWMAKIGAKGGKSGSESVGTKITNKLRSRAWASGKLV